jgi:hypothetical protein
MSNLFEVGMWVKDMSKGQIGKITDIGKELITLEVTYPYIVCPLILGITYCQDNRGIVQSWRAWVWDIEPLTEQEKLRLMVEKL